MFPVEREHHAEIINKFPQLFNHPILGKWLYAPQDTEDFEDLVTKILRQIPGRLDIFGVITKPKKTKSTKMKKVSSDKKVKKTRIKLNMKKPSLFSDKK